MTESPVWPDLPASWQWWTASQPAGPTEADYERAEQFLPQNVIPSLYNVNIEPGWIPGTSSFWYVNEGRTGKQFVLVLPNRNHEFNHDPSFIKRQFDYLVLHLRGVEPPEYTFSVPWLPD